MTEGGQGAGSRVTHARYCEVASRRRPPMKFSILLTASLMVVFAGTPRTQSHDVRLRAAQQKETVDGDMRAAIAVVPPAGRRPDDTAGNCRQSDLVQIGRCYERLGNTEVSEARKAYERVVAQYAGQDASSPRRKRGSPPWGRSRRRRAGPWPCGGFAASTATSRPRSVRTDESRRWCRGRRFPSAAEST